MMYNYKPPKWIDIKRDTIFETFFKILFIIAASTLSIIGLMTILAYIVLK